MSEEAKTTTAEKSRDWVGEAVQCFVKDAKDIDPTDPVKAIAAYFSKNATAELKARCKAEGKDAKSCWSFIEAVARKALGNHSGHIDPGVVYAIAMHYFEDVPKDWNGQTVKSTTAKAKPKKESKVEKLERKVAQSQVSAARKKELRKELAEAKRKERTKAKPKVTKPQMSQGFFFDMLETPGTEQESEVKE